MVAPLDILAIGAHPDDVEMTSGGYLALAADKGSRVGILHLSKGEMGTRGSVPLRVKEAAAAAKTLGAVEMRFGELKDGHIHCDDASIATVVAQLRELRPMLVIAPWTTCHHPDHEETARIVMRAVHFAGKVKYAAKGKPFNVGGLIHARYSYPFEPSFYVDISPVIGRKRDAILCYHSQFHGKRGEPQTRLSNPDFLPQFFARGHATGLVAGVQHAEEYRSHGPLVIGDPLALFAAQAPLPTLMR